MDYRKEMEKWIDYLGSKHNLEKYKERLQDQDQETQQQIYSEFVAEVEQLINHRKRIRMAEGY